MSKDLQTTAKSGRNKTSGEGVSAPLPALDITHLDKETRMPVKCNITPVGDSTSTQNSWKSIGDLARELAEKAKAAAHE